MTPPPAIDVLIVEDDLTTATLLVHALRSAELSTDVAGDVVEARRLLARGQYKVVLLDLMLPDGTGFEIIEFIKSSGLLPMHIVVVTAADPSRLVQLDRSVIKTVLFKPLDTDHVRALVTALVRGRSAVRPASRP